MESLRRADIPCDTLRIRHLPTFLSHCQREKLLKTYGAVKVKTINISEKHVITFAQFPSIQAASQAFLRLHQLQVRGERLSVEYAKKNTTQLSEYKSDQSKNSVDNAKEEAVEPDFQTFLKKLNGWAFSQIFTQPPSPNIWYKYSSPTTSTLQRIAIQMLKEPVFYCQVLHLMNKMNLPPPFEELEHEFPFLKDIYDLDRYRNIFGSTVIASNENKGSEEDEESELETDEDTEQRPKEIIPIKRKRAQSSKRLKIPKFVNLSKQTFNASSSSQKLIKPEDVFESLQLGDNKSLKIALKVDSGLEKRLDAGVDTDSSISSATITGQEESGFGLLYPVKKPDSSGTECTESTTQEFITCTELAANRVSVNDQRLLPVFKNYHPGKPACCLYIKNLSKQVEAKDLDFIYKRYVLPDLKDGDGTSIYNIRLMQEGRMKGQAFVTLQTVGQAQTALEETNGYIFKAKPMVVQFAKIAGNKKTP